LNAHSAGLTGVVQLAAHILQEFLLPGIVELRKLFYNIEDFLGFLFGGFLYKYQLIIYVHRVQVNYRLDFFLYLLCIGDFINHGIYHRRWWWRYVRRGRNIQ